MLVVFDRVECNMLGQKEVVCIQLYQIHIVIVKFC